MTSPSSKGLQVRSRTSSFAFKDKPRNLRDIGEQLGANLVVEGSVLRAGNRLRINAQLVQVAGDVPLWAERFDRELKDIFTIQDEISRAIVNRLRLTLGRGRGATTPIWKRTIWYLRGRALVDRRGIPTRAEAAELFERAIARDPGFAPAHAGPRQRVRLHVVSLSRGIHRSMTAYPIMRPAAVKALQLDPLLAEAHAAMGWVYLRARLGERREGVPAAIDLNPSLTQTYTSYSVSTLQPLQKYDEALRLLKRRRDTILCLSNVQREIGEVQLFSGRYAEAVDTFQRVREVDPDFPFVQTVPRESADTRREG